MAPSWPPFLSVALASLSQRLYDPTNQFWTQAELILYWQEAMREFNALTGYWRGDFTFPAVAGTTWYDITNPTVAPNTLRPLTLTTTSLYTIIEYHLLEPPTGAGTWTGSAQFALSDIQNAVAQRVTERLAVGDDGHDRVCKETHRVCCHNNVLLQPPLRVLRVCQRQLDEVRTQAQDAQRVNTSNIAILPTRPVLVPRRLASLSKIYACDLPRGHLHAAIMRDKGGIKQAV